MSIFEFAMKMEQDGEKFYRDLAGKTTNTGLKQIFTYLADEEVKHYNLFKGLLERQPSEYESTDILADSINVFAQMKESGAVDVTDDASQLEAYKQALD